FNPTGRLVASGLAGNNLVPVDGGTSRSAWLDAGPGNDLMPGGGNDMLIAGTTVFDHNQAARAVILAEWTSSRSYADRVASLSPPGGGLSATVLDTGLDDVLHAGSGMDWFFANLARDFITGRHDAEIVANLG